MPGFIIHMTAASVFLDSLPEEHKLREKTAENAFLVGNLAPDSVTNKFYSHFRDEETLDRIVQHPNLHRFLDRYGDLGEDPGVQGYFFHLYVDYRFFTEYIPRILRCYDEEGKTTWKTAKIKEAEVLKTGEKIPVTMFFSDEYYYGDYTKMNTWLVEKYHLTTGLDTEIKNPGITEVDYKDVKNVLALLESFLGMPAGAADHLKVFQKEEIEAYIREISDYKAVKLFMDEIQGKKS